MLKIMQYNNNCGKKEAYLHLCLNVEQERLREGETEIQRDTNTFLNK
jgi:hypothetical protein